MDLAMRSLVFENYNRARIAAKGGQLSESRLNKALGLILSGEIHTKINEYHTTIKRCFCPDHTERGMICKHMIACMIMYRVTEQVKLIWLGELDNLLWKEQDFVFEGEHL